MRVRCRAKKPPPPEWQERHLEIINTGQEELSGRRLVVCFLEACGQTSGSLPPRKNVIFPNLRVPGSCQSVKLRLTHNPFHVEKAMNSLQ